MNPIIQTALGVAAGSIMATVGTKVIAGATKSGGSTSKRTAKKATTAPKKKRTAKKATTARKPAAKKTTAKKKAVARKPTAKKRTTKKKSVAKRARR